MCKSNIINIRIHINNYHNNNHNNHRGVILVSLISITACLWLAGEIGAHGGKCPRSNPGSI